MAIRTLLKGSPQPPLTLIFLILIFTTSTLSGCVESDPRLPPYAQNQGASTGALNRATVTEVSEPYDTTDKVYQIDHNSKDMKIGNLRKTVDSEIQAYKKAHKKTPYSWFGYAKADVDRKNNIMDKCGYSDTTFTPLATLPSTITGVVTIYPRFYKKIRFCDSKSKTYGSFWLQDETGGIFISRNSKMAGFDAGDTVSINVRGVGVSYGQMMVTSFDNLRVIPPKNGETNKIYKQSITDFTVAHKHAGEVITVKGIVASSPTDSNFNTACIIPPGEDPSLCETTQVGDRLDCAIDKSPKPIKKCLLVSINKEIGQREAKPIKKGDAITVTGPVDLGYDGYEIVVMKIGQYQLNTP